MLVSIIESKRKLRMKKMTPQPRPLGSKIMKTALLAMAIFTIGFNSMAVKTNAAEAGKTAGRTANKVDIILNSMTLEEKIGQMFIVRPDVLDSAQVDADKGTGVTSITPEAAANIKKYNIGGVCLFASNLVDSQQLTTLTGELQKNSKTGMFIAIDEEGGRVARLARHDGFAVPNVGRMIDIGATGNTEHAFNASAIMGYYLKSYGINVDFAPVADVNSNPENIVIADRSFGSDPQLVSAMVSASIQGFHSQNMMTCAKHFPGHGDTVGDTHTEYVAVNKTWDQMLECEIQPFKSAIASGTDFVMVAHVVARNVTNSNLPATLSREIITDKLKNELGFDGIVITDAMEMGAISKYYNIADSVVLAVNAGVDIILMPADFDAAYNALIAAVQNGVVSQATIDDSVRRILTVKEKHGLLR